MSNGSPVTPGKKILIVDDNEVVIKTISLKLQGAGYRVVTAMDGTEAVTVTRKENPDLILLDINYPPEVGGVPWDGYRMMEWFQRLESSQKIPIIVITGSEEPKARERATKAGAVAFFLKPLDHDQLLKTIRATLGEPSANS
jgi:CheY-like chemotaxis protein